MKRFSVPTLAIGGIYATAGLSDSGGSFGACLLFLGLFMAVLIVGLYQEYERCEREQKAKNQQGKTLR